MADYQLTRATPLSIALSVFFTPGLASNLVHCLQRGWITLQEKHIEYEWKEINPYKKDKEFLAINPKGLVPALVHHGRNLNESQVIMEYLEDIGGPENSLFPKDPFDRAIARLWMDHVSKKICPAFFKVILAQEKDKQKQAEEELLKALTEFVDAMDEKGPYFFGEFFSLVDIMLVPWLLRQPLILKEYKGFEIPSSGSRTWDRWSKWLEASKNRASVVETTSEAEHYKEILERYANGTAQSEAARTTKAGGSFH